MCWERYLEQESEARKTIPHKFRVAKFIRQHLPAQPSVPDTEGLDAVELIVATPPVWSEAVSSLVP